MIASLLTACGSGSNSVPPSAVRVVNTTGTTLAMYLNNSAAVPTLAPGGVSNYQTVTPGTYTVAVSAVSGTTVKSAPGVNLPFGAGQSYTVIAYERDNVVSVAGAPLTDNLAQPVSGFVTLNIADVSQDAGPLDVYLQSPGTLPQLGQASFQTVQGLSIASTFVGGTYDVVVTGAGQPGDIRLLWPSVVFAGSTSLTAPFSAGNLVATLVLTSTGGALVNATLLGQAESATVFPNPSARVRVLSALPVANQSQVQVTVSSGTAAPLAALTLPSANAPNPTPYALVPGISASATASSISAISVVTGATTVAVTPPASNNSFTAGNDYTVLVYPDPVTTLPVAAVFTDNNQSVPNVAEIRLVNAGVSTTGGLTLYVNGKQIATNTLYGTVSAYGPGSPSSGATVVLNGFGYPTTIVQPTADFITGSVYTVFVYDPSAPALVIQDR